MAAIAREERLLNLLAALLSARTPLPFRKIRGRVSGYDDEASADALEKRFDRDKKDLRTLGVPIEFVPEDSFGRSGYVIPRDRFFLREIEFDLEEGIVLAAIERAVRTDDRDSFAASLRSALIKISVDSPLTEAFRESVAEQQLLDPHLPGVGDAPGRLGEIGAALASRSPIRFTYYSLSSAQTAERTVEPYGVGYFRGNWYLVGRDVEKGEERVFRTSRMRDRVEALDPTDYEIPAEFDLKERIGQAAWEIGSGREMTAEVRFHPDFAWMIEDNVRPGQEFVRTSDGGGVLTARVTDERAFLRWVASFGPMARVISPPDLVAGMIDRLEKVLARYEA